MPFSFETDKVFTEELNAPFSLVTLQFYQAVTDPLPWSFLTCTHAHATSTKFILSTLCCAFT